MKLLLAIVLSLPLSGCIAYDMRDQLVATNNTLTEMHFKVRKTNEFLDQANAHLATTEQKLSEIDERLAVLDSITKSLASLDDSLKAVRAVLEKLPIVGSAARDAPRQSDAQAPETPR